MASLFEQYEQDAAISSGFLAGTRPSVPEIISTGLIPVTLEDETPIFTKQRINFQPTDPISHLCVSNNELALVMKNKVLLRIDLLHPDQPDETELSRSLGEKSYLSRVYQMFLDPTGKHLLISLISTDSIGPFENLYLYRKSKKVHSASKMKGCVVSAVAWNSYENETSTGCILVGTTKGIIYETELASGEDRPFFHTGPEVYWRKVFDLSQGTLDAVTGLEFCKMPGTTSGGENKYFIMATTASRLYQFVGSVTSSGSEQLSFQQIFNIYSEAPEKFVEIPGHLGYSRLQFFSTSNTATPRSFGWMTGPGVLYGGIDCTGQSGQDQVALNTKLFPYPPDKADDSSEKPPLSMILTEFHVLVLFHDRLKAICVLNEQLAFEDIFTEMYGPMVGLTKDPMKGTIWAFSQMAVYRYKVMREDRNVWEVYLQKKEYDLAKEYCKNDPAKLDKVLSKQAEDFFSRKNYEESASLYAQTHNSFEEIALKFLQTEQEEALKVFLRKKMEGLKQQDKAQITMLIFWLMELYLNQMGTLRSACRHNTQNYRSIQAEFHKLLDQPRVKECIGNNRGAVYNLIASHGDEENLIYFTDLMKDFETIIQYQLQHKKYTEALEVLAKQSRPELFYQFSPTLMQAIPKQTVDTWIEQGRRLNPAKLIPSLVQYDQTQDSVQGSEAIRYLEFCVFQLDIRDQAIHNYLLAMYARLKPEQLMFYLNMQGQDEATIPYDLKFALRLCSELGLDNACVHIYTTMGLYEEAVDLALKVDDALARANADRPENNEELKKKLWLKIARHVVKEENDIEKAMEFLQKSDLIKIEDILPFFPDFVTIDHFKDAICLSLNEYNQHIEELKEEMEQATESAQEIRADIQTFRSKHAIVRPQDQCSSCSFPVLTRSFYLFPCHHLFHTDCLIFEVLPHLTATKKVRVEEIQRQMGTSFGREDTVSLSSTASSAVISPREKLMVELDDLVATECIYCGDIMIRCVDAPFIDPDEYNSVVQDWL